jgi:hypothetical protein
MSESGWFISESGRFITWRCPRSHQPPRTAPSDLESAPCIRIEGYAGQGEDEGEGDQVQVQRLQDLLVTHALNLTRNSASAMTKPASATTKPAGAMAESASVMARSASATWLNQPQCHGKVTSVMAQSASAMLSRDTHRPTSPVSV